MDVSNALTDKHKAAGMTLSEPDDHMVLLLRDGYILNVFSQNVSAAAIRQVADWWLKPIEEASE